MAARPRRTDRGKTLRLVSWNKDGVRGKKLKLEHSLSQHRVDICLLNETFLNPGKPSGLPIISATAQTDQQPGGGTAILVRRGVTHHPVPVPGLTMCRSSFQQPPDRPDVRRTDWANFQTQLEAEIPFNP